MFDIYAYVLFGVLGLCIGSFLNVVIYRLPRGMSLAKPDSHCTSCNYFLKWYDNIPVLSYLLLGGKCRKCKAKISPRYMLVEIFTCLCYLASAFLFWKSSPVYAVLCALTCSILICVFFIDLEHLIILDRFHIFIAILGIVAIFFDGFTFWYDHFIGCLVGGGVFLLIYFGAILALKKEGLGFGDVKLAFATGLLLGWQKFLLAILLASILACLVLIPIKYAKNHSKHTEYPFGPFIAFGVLVALLFGAKIISWYISLLTF